MRIVDVREITKPIASPIRNAYIDFQQDDDEPRGGGHGRRCATAGRVVGYGFNSNGRYGQGGLIRERFRNRILEADPKSLLDDAGDNIDPPRSGRR